MGSRKKSKTKIQKQDDTVESEPQAPPSTTNDPKEADGATVTPSPQAQASEDTANQDHTDPIYIPVGQPRTPVSKPRGQGWYGSWKSKAAPVTEVRRESISASPRPALNGDTPRTSQKQDFNDVNNASPHRYMSTGSIRSTKATPLAATTTNISITSGKSTENITNNGDEVPVKDIDPPLPPDPSAESAPVITSSQPSEVTGKEPPAQTASGGWLSGWWSRPDGYDESSNKKVDDEIALVDEAKNKPLPASTPSLETQDQPKDLASTAPVESTNKALENDSAGKIKIDQPTVDSKSWFWRWSATQNSQILVKLEDNPKHEAQKTDNGTNRPDTPVSQTTADAEQDSKSIRSINATIKSVKNVGGRKTSGWAFWSRESNDTTEATDPDATTKQVGELAVANTPSASHPEAAQFNSSTADEVPQEPVKPTKPAKKNTGLKKQPNQTKVVDKQVPTPVSTSPTVKVSSKAVEAATTLLRLDSHKQDILLPEFRKTYSMVQKQSMLQNLRHYFLGDGPQDHPHLHVMGNVPKVKKALAIGVHGFFPNFMVQRVLGPPTGTSIKFSNMAAGAIKSWTESQGYECEIEKVALEGEGLIADRVDTLWKLLLNWIDHVRSADFILLACHSQGVPVTIMLVDRLIKFGCISSAKIGICAMAGVNLGPFAEYRTQLFGRSALELFDFADSSSKVSISYRSALEQVLRHNVKIVFTGSLDDQLVSLEVCCSNCLLFYLLMFS